MLSPLAVHARQSLGIGILLAFAAAPASAQIASWYLGAGAGTLQAQASISKMRQPPATCSVPLPLGCTSSVDDSSVSFSGFGGVEVNEYVAFEVGYADLPGSYNVRLDDPNFPSPAYLDVQQDSEAFFFRSVLTLPLRELASAPSPTLQKISVSAVLGFSHWRSDTDQVIDITGARGGFASSASHRASGNNLTFGARLNYDVTEAVRVSGAWDRYQDLGNSSTAVIGPIFDPTRPPFRTTPVNSVDDDVDVFSLNLIYRFK